MQTVVVVECLRCGLQRAVRGSPAHTKAAGSCPRCEYVGWEYADLLSEDERRALRDVPVEFRSGGRRATLLHFR